MINIGLYYKVRAGYEEEFERSFANALSALRNGHFGFVDGKLYRETGGSREYLLYTEWEGLDSFRSFMESNEYAQTVELGKAIVEGQSRHRIFRE